MGRAVSVVAGWLWTMGKPWKTSMVSCTPLYQVKCTELPQDTTGLPMVPVSVPVQHVDCSSLHNIPYSLSLKFQKLPSGKLT